MGAPLTAAQLEREPSCSGGTVHSLPIDPRTLRIVVQDSASQAALYSFRLLVVALGIAVGI